MYTVKPAPVKKTSNKIDHHLKIIDFYIKEKCPDYFLIEQQFGKYEPDIYFIDKSNNHIAVEIQLTPISTKRMQQKVNDFVYEYDKSHAAKTLVICSNYDYKKLEYPKGFRVIKQPLPNEIFY